MDRELLTSLGLIRVEGGKVRMGTDKPLVCMVEGYRHNEVPITESTVAPFWMGRTKVTNHDFEKVSPKHVRPPQALEDLAPVVDITYGEAVRFCKALNKKFNLNLRLPTEPEWVFAAAPYGWEFIHPGDEPNITQGHVFKDGHKNGAVEVNDSHWKQNFLDLDQMGHNVSEMTGGAHRIQVGNYGFETDGTYYIARGGNYGHCPNSLGVSRRMLVDIVDRNPRIGFRLAHADI